MNKISCDVCLDLMPLVNDNAASEDSQSLVKKHINHCQSCHTLYDSLTTEVPVMNEEKMITKIKKQLFIFAIGIIVIAAVLGVALSDGIGMFYNILIMPSIGIIGSLILNKKAYLTPIALFIFSYIWLFVKYVYQGVLHQASTLSSLTVPMIWSLIYVGLCAVGVIIGALLKFAFRKEVVK